MTKTKAEYIWLDGHKPTQKLRSKTKIINTEMIIPGSEKIKNIRKFNNVR